MDSLYQIIFIGIVSGVATSLLASVLHKMNWYKRIKKCHCQWLGFFITNLYQFNYLPFNAISLIREIGFNLAFANILVLLILSEYDFSNLNLIFVAVIIIFSIRTLIFLLLYSKFFNEKILNEI